MNDEVLKIENVSKKYSRHFKHVIRYGMMDLGRNLLGMKSSPQNLREGEFWALHNLNLKVCPGETVGVIGPNGSGKSTLLKLIHGIFLPDHGTISVRGKVGALIEVGAGFHPMLTGKENIYVSGAILGFSKSEIDKMYNEIVDFADIGMFIDSPVKYYSSGMLVRLGFSLAVSMVPDILLVDEVLSVGDLAFQNKSLRRLSEIRKKAQAVIFVSHNLDHVQSFCQRVLLLRDGESYFLGKTEEALVKYYELSREKNFDQFKNQYAIYGKRNSSGDIEIIGNGLLDENGKIIEKIKIGDDLTFYFDFRVKCFIEHPVFSVTLRDEKDHICLWRKSNEGREKMVLKKIGANNDYRLIVSFSSPPFMPGVYRPTLGIYNGATLERYEKIFNFSPFVIKGDVIPRGLIRCDAHWDIQVCSQKTVNF